MRKISLLAAIVAAGVLAAAGCSSNSSSGGSNTTTPSSSVPSGSSSASASTAQSSTATSGSTATSSEAAAPALTGTLTIYAAASLKLTFDKLRTEFQTENPGVKVSEITYNGSSTLVTQLINGAPADVFASADDANMKKATNAKLVAGAPIEFASNTLEIAVPPGNPKKITGLKDLTNPALKVVLCAPGVPCGTAAQTALKAGGITLKPASEEQDVTSVLTKVETGNADAGMVYKTDVQGAAGKVTGVDFPESSKAVNHYPIAALSGAKNPAAAKAFIAMVTGPTGQQVLAAAGFGKA